MCAQCMATAAVTVAAASGVRASLASRLSPPVTRRLTAVLAVLAVLGAGIGLGGSG
jgi:hypothetical protein